MKTHWRHWALATGLCAPFLAAQADTMIKVLPFQQAWTDTAQITGNDNWGGVQGIEGYLGQDLTTTTGTDPQTLVGTSLLANDLDVVANQTNTSISNGGVIEFEITNPTIALQGSGTADAPYIVINIDTRSKTNINVAYNLRDLDGSTDNAIQPVALQYRVGALGSFTNVPAGFVADATTGPSLATLVTAVSATLPAAANNQQLVQVRIITANAVGNDESVGIDDISITGTYAGGVPILSISDASAPEGDGEGWSGMLLVTLSEPAGPGGVSFQAETAVGTATPDEDYVPQSGWGGVIAEGETMMGFVVPVHGDTTPEADETFFINVFNVTGAVVGDAQGVGTILNDDFVVTPIHDIQGAGATSPVANQFVTLEGIVTGRKGNGFFVQATDAEADADPLTSEGVFVFTGSAPSADAAVGNRVRVQGTVVEYIPAADPNQLPLTEITGSPVVTQLSSGNLLPTPVVLTAEMTKPNGGLGQLEPLEGMRVTATSLTTIAATEGNATPYNATGSANGIIHAVLTGVARPFREPGIQAPDSAPGGGSIPPIPRWDGNPEILTVDSDTLGGAAFLLDLPAGSVIAGLTGPLDYGFRRYTLHRDPAVAINVTAGPEPRAARAPDANEFTVASYNLERFYDNINDPAVDDSIATAAAYDKRLTKASLGIRDYLHAPDILVAVEIENLSVLQALATRINTDAVTAGQPDPQYVAYLAEGNDIGGIDVGVLVKTATVGNSVPRVEVVSVTQVGKDTTWVQPDGSTGILNDRPPLAVDAVVHYADGRAFPITAIGVHQRSLIDSELDTAAGDRVRKKRQRQAEFLADYIQQRQVASPATRIVTLGDFNAFAFNDGLADTMNVVSGTPTPDEQTAVPGDGIDLVDPDLVNLGELAPAAERYSFVFDGNAQTLDHVLVNEELIVYSSEATIDHARINADFSETNRGVAETATRTADHDPVIAYFAPRAIADLAITATLTEESGLAGHPILFASTVRNNGPDTADSVGVGFALDAELPTMSVIAPAGWDCDAAQVGHGSTSVACHADALADDAEAGFVIRAEPTKESMQSAVNLAAAVNALSLDLESDNDQATAQLGITARADLVAKVSGPIRTLRYGDSAPFVATVRNAGPNFAKDAWMTLQGNAPAANVSINAPAGWNCTVAEGESANQFEATCAATDLLAVKAAPRFDATIIVPAQASLTVTANTGSTAIETRPADNESVYTKAITGVP